MGMVVLDYVQSDGRWQLSVPPVGISEQGRIGSDSGLPRPLALPGVPPDRIARLFLVPDEGGKVRWQAGRCAVLETIGQDGEVGRRFSYRRTGGSWEVAREELLGKAGTELVARFDDYRSVGASGTWAYHQELEEPNRGSRVTFDTRSLRTEGVVPSLFSFMDTEG